MIDNIQQQPLTTEDDNTLSKRIRLLASDPTKRTKIARIIDVIDDIELSLSAGVSRSFIVEELVAGGLEINLASFATTLRRIRKKRGKPSANFKYGEI